MYIFLIRNFLSRLAFNLDVHNDDSNNRQLLQYLRTTAITMSSTTIDDKHPGDFVIRDVLLGQILLR